MKPQHFPLRSAAFALLFVFAQTLTAYSQTSSPTESYPEYISAPEGFEDHQWGADLALTGDTLFISSPGIAGEDQTGAVHQFIFNGSDWDLEHTFESPGDSDDGFGHSIAVADSILAVGAPLAVNEDDIQSGKAYIFIKNEDGWEHTYQFSPEYAQEDANFGFSVAADSGRVLVGAPEWDFIDEVEEDTTANIGRAFGYDFTWDRDNGEIRESNINIHMNRENERYGYDLDINGSWAVVGTNPEGLSEISAPNRFAIVEQPRLANPGWNTRETVSRDDGPHGSIGTVAMSRETAFIAPPVTRTSQAFAYNFDRGDEGVIHSHQELNPSHDREHLMYGKALQANDTTAAVGGRDMVDMYQWIEDEDRWGRTHIAHANTDEMTFGSRMDFNDSFVVVNGVTGSDDDRTPQVFWMQQDQLTSGESEPVAKDHPTQIELHQAYPNPFNPTTQIDYTLPESSEVQLEVFDVTGRKVSTLVEGTQASGTHSVTFDGTELSSGVYIYRLTAGEQVLTRQMTLVK